MVNFTKFGAPAKIKAPLVVEPTFPTADVVVGKVVSIGVEGMKSLARLGGLASSIVLLGYKNLNPLRTLSIPQDVMYILKHRTDLVSEFKNMDEAERDEVVKEYSDSIGVEGLTVKAAKVLFEGFLLCADGIEDLVDPGSDGE